MEGWLPVPIERASLVHAPAVWTALLYLRWSLHNYAQWNAFKGQPAKDEVDPATRFKPVAKLSRKSFMKAAHPMATAGCLHRE